MVWTRSRPSIVTSPPIPLPTSHVVAARLLLPHLLLRRPPTRKSFLGRLAIDMQWRSILGSCNPCYLPAANDYDPIQAQKDQQRLLEFPGRVHTSFPSPLLVLVGISPLDGLSIPSCQKHPFPKCHPQYIMARPMRKMIPISPCIAFRMWAPWWALHPHELRLPSMPACHAMIEQHSMRMVRIFCYISQTRQHQPVSQEAHNTKPSRHRHLQASMRFSRH